MARASPKFFIAEPELNLNLNGSNCIIVLANAEMTKWAKKFVPGRVLVMDTTFGTNRYGYSLLVMIAIDDRGKGLPVCFALLMHEDTESFAKALTAHCVQTGIE